MSGKRAHSRINFYSYCVLVDQEGYTYEALLGDISLSGASVLLNCDTHFQAGDLCQLLLNDDSAVIPLHRTGKIIWRGSRIMGMSLLN
jgi:hypothetical protein